MEARAVYADGSIVDVTQRVESWRSSDPATASISSTGLVHALREGSVEFRATYTGLESIWTWRVYRPSKAGPPGPDEVIGYAHEVTPTSTIDIGEPRIEVFGGPRNGLVLRGTHEGRFRLDGLQEAGFDLLVTKSGYRPLRIHVAQLGVDLSDAMVMEPDSTTVSEALQGDVCDPRRTISTVFTPTVDGIFRITSVRRTSVTLSLYEGSTLLHDGMFVGVDRPLADGHTYELRATGGCDHGARAVMVTYLRPR